MLKNLRDRKRFAVIAFVGDEIPPDLLTAIRDNQLLDAAGTYGDPEAGRPIEYDHLTIVHDEGSVDIEFYNRGISLIFGDVEREKQIHRVCCVLRNLSH